MADKEKNVVLNFKMDGQVEYAETLKELNMIMNNAAKEYKNHIAAMGNDASATDKLRAEKKKLEIQMEAAQKRTAKLAAEFEEMSKNTNTTSGQLNKMYGKLLDSERAESALQKSLDRVNEGLSDEAQQAREAQDVLAKLKNESKLLDSEQKNLTSSFKLQNAELGDNATEAEKTELAQKQLTKQMDLTDRVVKNLEQQLEATKRVYGDNSIEVNQLEAKINDAKTAIAKFDKTLDDVKSSSVAAGDGMAELGKKIDINNLLEATELLQGVTDKIIELGQTGMDSALQFGDSQTNLQANLGLTGKEVEKLNGVVNDVFKNGVVGSMDEATQAVVLVKQSFGDLNNTDLENLTNKITTISKRTGTDVQENINAASKLMQSFGISGDKALDLITAGYQNGLNKSGDFLDTLNEYSPHFKAAGYSADQMLQIIKNGMENGAMNTDKAADAVKEFQIRLGDGSFSKIMGSFSKDTQSTFEKWKDGKATVADVANSVSKDLNKMSPTEQQKALSLLSSQFEDLGIDGAKALFSVGDAFKDTTGKADEMAKKTPGEKWQSSLRELQQSLLPIGQNLVDALTPVVEMLAEMGGWFGKLPGPVQTFITVFGGLLAIAAALTPVIIALAVAIGSLDIALLPIIAVVVAVAAAIAGIVLVIQNWGKITDWISEKIGAFAPLLLGLLGPFGLLIGAGIALYKNWDTLKNKAGELKDKVVNKVNELKEGFVNKINDLKNGAVGKFNDLKTKAGNAVSSFKNNVINKASELKTGFVNKANDLKNGAVNKFNDLKTKAGNSISSLKNNVVGKVNDLKSSFVDKVNSLKNSAVSKFNDLKTKAGSAMSQAKNKIVAPIESAKNKISGIISRIKGFFSGLHLKIPKISLPPMPHFNISGKFSLKPPSVPKISVDWRAKGAIFTEPTIFGVNNGRLQGAGEAGPEAALPLNDETLGAIGKGIADSMNLGSKGPVYLQIDGKTFAQIIGDYTDAEGGVRIRRKDRGLA
ncbi:phage tail tape measure protein [Heyndrickxia acidiproducens]|uniref:phage tail tape measure protein n=1 Tax=Heyndrickxia acidiproducens TaxID=1121084 RepID=UPI000364795B|nr:phage tail tape measure protein [Heyndrickxia acidiproducens]